MPRPPAPRQAPVPKAVPKVAAPKDGARKAATAGKPALVKATPGKAVAAKPAPGKPVPGKLPPGKAAAGKARKGSRAEEKDRLRGAAGEGEEVGEEAEEEKGAEAEEDESEEAEDLADVGDDLDVTERSEVKALMERGREKGFLTYEEVNDALPSDIVSSDQIDDVMSMFGEHDIEVVDDAKKMKLPDKPPEPEAKVAATEEEKEEEEEDAGYGKSNDPVRMYLRKMGSVSLLTREGEVEIAKRIEEGEKAVLTAVLGSSLAIKEILDLGERLRKGKIRVREIIKDAGEEASPGG